jgi:hypothetical protein
MVIERIAQAFVLTPNQPVLPKELLELKVEEK